MVYRGFEIRPHSNTPQMLLITHHGKAGKIPTLLNGLFTSYYAAKQSIDVYLTDKVE